MNLAAEGNALVYEGEDGEEEQEPIEFDDVDMDFYTDATEKWGATGVESTPHWVRKKYAFGIKGIPREETNWLEVSCDFPCELKAESDIRTSELTRQRSRSLVESQDGERS